MSLYDDIFDGYSDETTDFLRDGSRLHYDYHGCLPQDDDYADHYKSFQRVINAF